jgi:hypothetical protein
MNQALFLISKGKGESFFMELSAFQIKKAWRASALQAFYQLIAS